MPYVPSWGPDTPDPRDDPLDHAVGLRVISDARAPDMDFVIFVNCKNFASQ
jgi:hypothetical protein